MIIIFILVSVFSVQANEDYETTVNAPRVSRLPLSQTSITEEEIGRKLGTSWSDLLKTEPGIDFVSERAGGQSSLYLRGASSSNLLVIIDGVKANDPSDPTRRFDFSTLDSRSIKEIRILRGPEAIAYGSDALAGVMLIRTTKIKKEETEVPDLHLSQTLSSHESSITRGALSQRLSPSFGYSLQGLRSANKGPSLADVPGGDLDEKENIEGSALLDWEASKLAHFKLSGGIRNTNQDLDGGPFLDDKTFKSEFRSYQSRLELSGVTDEAKSSGYFSSLDFSRQNRNYLGTLFPSKYEGDRWASDLSGFNRWTDEFEVHLGGSFQEESMQVSGSDLLPKTHQSILGAFVLLKNDWSESFKSDLSVRMDREIQNNTDAVTTRGGVSYVAVPDKIEFFAGVGTGWKTPTLYERFSPLYGNKNLTPERSIQGEVSAKSFNRLTTTVFRRNDSDPIEFNSLTSKYYNAGQVRTVGLENKLSIPLDVVTEGLGTNLSLTALRAKSLSTGQDLPRRARWKAGGDLYYQRGVFRGGVEGDWKSGRLDSTQSKAWDLPSAAVFNAYAGATFFQALNATLRVNDLADRRVPEALGYTPWGRVYSFSLSIGF